MGRQVRRVPAGWQHPRLEDGRYQPKHDESFEAAAAEWKRGYAEWQAGNRPSYAGPGEEFWEHDSPPDRDYYRPDWPESERTHYMMYENTSEGTPISPAFATPEQLARWLEDTGASSFARMTATYEQWLSVCRGGWAPSAVIQDGVMQSGVEFAASASVTPPSARESGREQG